MLRFVDLTRGHRNACLITVLSSRPKFIVRFGRRQCFWELRAHLEHLGFRDVVITGQEGAFIYDDMNPDDAAFSDSTTVRVK